MARSHRHLLVYLVALVVVWVLAAATWRMDEAGRLILAPVAQLLLYLLVVLASSVAGHRLIVAARGRDEDDAGFRVADYRWSVRHDLGGRVWFTTVWAGIAAFAINVTLLFVAEIAFGAGDPGTVVVDYLGWLGSAIAGGALLGSFSALIATVAGRWGGSAPAA